MRLGHLAEAIRIVHNYQDPKIFCSDERLIIGSSDVKMQPSDLFRLTELGFTWDKECIFIMLNNLNNKDLEGIVVCPVG